jgi:hypothetical protein
MTSACSLRYFGTAIENKSSTFELCRESVNSLQTDEIECGGMGRMVKREVNILMCLGIQDLILNAMPMMPQILQILETFLKIVINTS